MFRYVDKSQYWREREREREKERERKRERERERERAEESSLRPPRDAVVCNCGKSDYVEDIDIYRREKRERKYILKCRVYICSLDKHTTSYKSQRSPSSISLCTLLEKQ